MEENMTVVENTEVEAADVMNYESDGGYYEVESDEGNGALALVVAAGVAIAAWEGGKWVFKKAKTGVKVLKNKFFKPQEALEDFEEDAGETERVEAEVVDSTKTSNKKAS